MKILVVDDELEIAAAIAQMLEAESFKVTILDSAIKAIEKFTNFQEFQLIISDFNMPVMNGLEFLNKIKSTPCPPPFILFSGKADTLLKEELDGVYRILEKPRIDDLLKAVKEIYKTTIIYL